MKKLYVLIFSIFLVTLSISQLSAQGIPREVKEWCLSVNDQNKDLTKKLLIKDSIILVQDSLNTSKTRQIKSYQRDSISWEISNKASGESMARLDTVVQAQKRTIKRVRTERDLTIGGAVLVILLVLLL